MAERPTREDLQEQIDNLERLKTELKNKEQSLRQSEARLNSFLDNAPVGMAIWDREFRYLYINDVLQKMNGPSREAHLGRTIFEVLPKAAPVIEPLFKQIMATGRPILNRMLSGEVPSRPDEISHYLTSYFPMAAGGDDSSCFGGIVVEVTDRIRTEEALKKGAAKFRTLFENMAQGVFYQRADGELIDVNPAALEMFALTRGQFLGRTSMDPRWKVVDQAGNDLPGERHPSMRALRTAEPVLNEIVGILTPDRDDLIWLSINAIPQFKNDASTPYQVFVTMHDITERRRAEARDNEARARLLLAMESADAGVWEWDYRTGLVSFDKIAYRMLGYETDLPAITGEWWISQIHPEDRPLVEGAYSAFISGETDTYKVEFRLKGKDGGYIWVASTARILHRDKAGNPQLVVGIHRDITARKQAQEQRDVLQAKSMQSQKMESIGTLAGGIAHDFNNILSSIIGFTELSLSDVRQGSLLADNLQEVYAAGKRAKDLVKQILRFARQSEEEMKPVQLGVIAEEALKFIRSSIPTTISVQYKIQSKALVMGNATQIHQILMNLFTNAAQAMEEEGGILDVSLRDVVLDGPTEGFGSRLNPGAYIEIKISDTGVGIAPVHLDTIFEPYFTTKPPGEGTGMGLAVTHGIIESHAGNISVESQLGRGATFTIYFPITDKQAKSHLPSPGNLPSGTERILFVDDEATIAKMGKQLLERLGYEVTARTSSIEALELFRSRRNDFDLIITDMTMPNMTGDELAVQLIKIRPDIPVILCTGYSHKMRDENARTLGIRALALKPIVQADLAVIVRKALDGK